MPLLSRISSLEKEYRPLSMVSLAALLFSLGTAVAWFVLPILAEKLFNDLFLVGLLIAIPSAIGLLLDIPAGGFSDHVGRKKPLIVALVLMVFLGFLLPSVDSMPRFIIFMVVFGFATLNTLVPARAYIMDIAPKKKTGEFFGIFEAAYQIGFAVGPLIAGAIIADQFYFALPSAALFYSFACLAAALVLLSIKETVTKGKSTFVSVKDVIQKDRLYFKSLLDYKTLHYAGVAILISTFILVFVDGIVWTFEPLYTTMGVDTGTVGVILMMFVLPYIIFETPAGMLADRLGKIPVFVMGLIVAGVFLIAFGLTQNPTILIISAFVATTGLAFARPAIDGYLTDISASKERGGITGVWNTAEDAGYVAGPIIGGAVAQSSSIGFTFILVGIVLLLALPLVYLAIRVSRH
jgi:DHA1 family multidrug resistance protein-like MFS transporter